MQRVAIIGAGITGLTLARTLGTYASVEVFEKARGVGGRMSTRYADPFYFDHGAQFFTARSKEFQVFLEPLIASNIVQEWKPKLVGLRPGEDPYDRFWFEPHYVPVPHMNSVCKYLAQGVKVHLGAEVAPLVRSCDSWLVSTIQGEMLGMFDHVISTAPPLQTQRLLGEYLPKETSLSNINLGACYTLMLGLSESWSHRWQAATVDASSIGWIGLNSSKPGRELHAPSLVIQATEEWSQTYIDADIPAAEAMLRAALELLIDDIPPIAHSALHRWRYALPPTSGEAIGPYHHPDLRLGAIGDWTGAGDIEGAWQQTMALASLYTQDFA